MMAVEYYLCGFFGERSGRGLEISTVTFLAILSASGLFFWQKIV